MIIRLAICAIVLASMSFNASATYSWGSQHSWDNWNQSDDAPSWDHKKQKLKKLKNLLKKLKQHRQDRWCNDVKQWEWDCNWGSDNKQPKQKDDECNDKPRDCKGEQPNCDPPTAVPTPTAALAGLGVMGLMLARRRNKKA